MERHLPKAAEQVGARTGIRVLNQGSLLFLLGGFSHCKLTLPPVGADSFCLALGALWNFYSLTYSLWGCESWRTSSWREGLLSVLLPW